MNSATNRLAGRLYTSNGRADLLDDAAIEHHQPVAERHRLDLVVGDEDAGGLQPALQLADLVAHLHAQLGVEVGERLVEEEGLGLAHDGPAHGDPLALAAGELAGLAVEQLREPENARRIGHALLDHGLGRAQVLEPIGHVLPHGHVRVERVVLEDHGDVALGGLQVVDPPLADMDVAGGRRLQPGDDPQQGGLAAARRPEDDEKLAVGDLDRDLLQDLDAAEALDDVGDGDLSHGRARSLQTRMRGK